MCIIHNAAGIGCVYCAIYSCNVKEALCFFMTFEANRNFSIYTYAVCVFISNIISV